MEFKDTLAWSVIGSTGNTYHLVKTEDGITCDCLGYLNRGSCKHEKALKEQIKPKVYVETWDVIIKWSDGIEQSLDVPNHIANDIHELIKTIEEDEND